MLAGAKFILCTSDDKANKIKFSKATDKDGNEIANTYIFDPDGTIEEFTTDDTGKITLEGLDSVNDAYYLFETAAPLGYNLVNGATKVAIDSDGKVYKNRTEATDKVIKVVNNSGTVLPSTGGMGTTIFYIIGGILVAAAVVLLVTKKRMNNADK